MPFLPRAPACRETVSHHPTLRSSALSIHMLSKSVNLPLLAASAASALLALAFFSRSYEWDLPMWGAFLVTGTVLVYVIGWLLLHA
ncbi:MAG: hypothetical protein HY365_00995 [Candidatus Aenigmarchaeota archaeon]|nr:hypothetical protein [Candidatus Aenigmarchaeota archaeon]